MTLDQILVKLVAKSFTEADKTILGLFGRRILRSISGAVHINGSGEQDGILKYINYEYMMSQIWVSNTKIKRLKWACHTNG
jgi:hypothetical protein